jgi:hypothetical protein
LPATIAAASFAAACGTPEQGGPPSGLALALHLPPALAADITALELVVLDEGAQCVGADAEGGSSILETSLELAGSTTLHVSAGTRTFQVVALIGAAPAARGCRREALIAGQTHAFTIVLEPYDTDVDAGAADAMPGGPDAGAADAPAADAPPPDAAPDAPPPDAALPDAASPDASIADAAPIDATPPPANDTCATPTPLIAGLLGSGTLVGAKSDVTLSCVAGAAGDVFFAFTLATAQSVTVLSTSTTDTALALLAGDCATELACAESTAVGEQIELGHLAAGTYRLAVKGVGGSAGSFTIGYTTGPPRPVNDQCTGAILLGAGVSRTGDTTVNALDDADGSCGDTTSGDVVYSFAVPGPANARARLTVSNATGWDPVLYARAGACTGAEVGCAQLATGASETLDMPNLAPGTYYVWVDAQGGGAGTFDIGLELLPAVPPPGHDTCGAPDPLVEGVIETHSTVGAADDLALSCLTSDSRDTVHELTLASPRAVLITLIPLAPTWSLAVALRAMASCATTPDLSCVASAASSRIINRPSLAAGAYDVVVDGAPGASGDYTIVYETRASDASFGYWLIDTTGAYVSIAGDSAATKQGIPLTLTTDTTTGAGDEWSQTITLPFSFTYFGTGYPSVHANANLFLTFDTPPTGSASWTNDCPLDATSPTNAIAPFWDDGIAHEEGPSELWTKSEGVAPNRRFIIEYKNWQLLHCAGTTCTRLKVNVGHQVILYENGDIDFRYGPRSVPDTSKGCGNQHVGCSATIGIEGQVAGATDADGVQCNVVGIAEGRVFSFIHPR